jgi:hypothetical protein
MRYVKNDTIYSIHEIRNLYPNISMNEGNDLSHLGFTELIETQPPQKEGHYVVEDIPVNNTQTWKLVKIEEPIIDVITIRQARELLIELDMFDTIEAAINQIQDPKEKRKLLNYWEYSDSFNLNHPQLLDIAGLSSGGAGRNPVAHCKPASVKGGRRLGYLQLSAGAGAGKS